MSSLDDYFKMQERLSEQLNRTRKLSIGFHAPNTETFSKALSSPLSELVETTEMFNPLSQTPLQDVVNNHWNLHHPFQDLFDNSPFEKTNTLSDVLQKIPAISSDVGVQESLHSLLSSMDRIRIIENYVEIPKELIPVEYPCEDTQNQKSNKHLIKFTYSAAQYLITNFFIPLLLQCFMSISPASWQEEYHKEEMAALNTIIQQNNKEIALQNEANELQREANEIQRETNEIQQEYLTAILSAIDYLLVTSEGLAPAAPEPVQNSDCVHEESRFLQSGVEPDFQDNLSTASSAIPRHHPSESMHPTTSDSADSSGTPSESD